MRKGEFAVRNEALNEAHDQALNQALVRPSHRLSITLILFDNIHGVRQEIDRAAQMLRKNFCVHGHMLGPNGQNYDFLIFFNFFLNTNTRKTTIFQTRSFQSKINFY